MNKLFKAHSLVQNMEILAIFKPPELYKKILGREMSFFIWTQEIDIFIGVKNFWWKLLFRLVKIDWKKTTPSISIPFSSKVGLIS